MKYVLAPLVAFLLVVMSYGGAAGSWAPSTADAGSIPEPGAPGPYTGPAEVPADWAAEGWRSWADDDDEFAQCGPVKLVFLNPDLQEDDNGIVQAQGTFFIQFQAVAPPDANVDEITRFSFSFGKGDPALDNNPTLNCNESLPDTQLGKGTAGAYLLFYRSDFNSEDGFFVPIETWNVPDGDYAAAVHAYTGDDLTGYTEVGRGWTYATVDNCVGQSLPNSCPNDTDEDRLSKDRTMPWPIVLPADGEQTNDVNGLTIEFAEKMQDDTVKASIDGEEVTLSEWTPPERDTDLMPLNDETDCPVQVRSLCETKVYGVGYKWEGQIGEKALIRVVGKDLAGNEVTKQIHRGSGVAGGTVSLQDPEIDFSVRSADSQTIQAGDDHPFLLRLDNIGGADAHVNLMLDYNETSIQAKWQGVENLHDHSGTTGETHVQIAPGEQTELNVIVTSTTQTPEGTYPITAILEYPVAGVMVTKSRELFLNVDSDVKQVEVDNVTEDEPVVEDSPAAGFSVAVLGVVGALAVGLRRRD